MVKSKIPQLNPNPPVVKRVRKVEPVNDALYEWIIDGIKQPAVPK